jgi:hypothetical protein
MTDAASATMEMPPPPSSPVTSRHTLPRRRFFSDMPDRGLFCFAALLGFVAICLLKVNGHDARYVAAFAVLLMVAYGAVAFNMPLVQIRLDRLGDNFYYLGFIFTLASLSAALMQLQAGMKIEELLGSFGIALVTTIVGIAGRVTFVQLRGEIDDIEEQVRHDLAATASDLRAQLFSAIREFETFRTGLLQILTETKIAFEDAKSETTGQKLRNSSVNLSEEHSVTMQEFQTFRSNFGKASRTYVDQLEKHADFAAENLEKSFKANQMQAEHAAEGLQAIMRAIEDAVNRLGGMELPGNRLNTKIRKFTRALKQLLTRPASGIEPVGRAHRRRVWWPFTRR